MEHIRTLTGGAFLALAVLSAPAPARAVPLAAVPASFSVRPCPGWSSLRSGDTVTLRLRNDWIAVRFSGREVTQPLVETDRAMWQRKAHFRSALVTAGDDWTDYDGPKGRRRRVFQADLGLMHLDACLEADHRDFDARCMTLAAVLRSFNAEATPGTVGSTLNNAHGLSPLFPLPTGVRVRQLLSATPAQLKLANTVTQFVVLVSNALDEADAARTAKAPMAVDPVVASSGEPVAMQSSASAVGPESGAPAAGESSARSSPAPSSSAAVAAAPTGSLVRPPAVVGGKARDLMRDLGARIGDSFAHVREFTLLSGEIADRSLGSAGAPPPPLKNLVEDYDAWAKDVGARSIYRDLKGNAASTESAQLLYQVGTGRRTLVAIKLARHADRVDCFVVAVDGEVEDGVSDVLRALISGDWKGFLDDRR